MRLYILICLIILIFLNISKEEHFKNNDFKNNGFNRIIINKQIIKKQKYDPKKVIQVFDNFKNKRNCISLFEIKDNKLNFLKIKNYNKNVHNNRRKFVTSLISETLKVYKIQDMLFIVGLSDYSPNIKFPNLASVYVKGMDSISIPINWWSYFGNKNKEFNDKDYQLQLNNYKNTKKNRKQQIVFRGTNNCDTRRKLLKLGKEFSQYTDIKLPNGKNDPNFIPNKEIINNYQFFFVIRGRGKWTGSMNQFALANGVIFIIEEDTKQPFELLLEPNQDYISIKNDLSDFEEQIKKIEDVQLMEKIRKNLKLKTKFFEPNNLKNYIYLSLTNLYN
jgi:hypothetical protein